MWHSTTKEMLNSFLKNKVSQLRRGLKIAIMHFSYSNCWSS